MTRDQAKKRLRAEGVSFKQFAEENSINYRTLQAVLNGHNKGYRGNAHRAAVALGMK
ncbi:MAG: DNA-binding protein [Proteobacteria bacterium]|nr:DNA-binding protein [Pseudomonadota bacterium]